MYMCICIGYTSVHVHVGYASVHVHVHAEQIYYTCTTYI